MPRQRVAQPRRIERYRVTLSEHFAQERALIKRWFAIAWGRRQSWARHVIYLGLCARRKGLAQIDDEPRSADSLGEDRSGLTTHMLQRCTINLSLSRGTPEDARCLQELDQLPHSRRSQWIRETLVAGLRVSEAFEAFMSLEEDHQVDPLYANTLSEILSQSVKSGPSQTNQAKPVKQAKRGSSDPSQLLHTRDAAVQSGPLTRLATHEGRGSKPVKFKEFMDDIQFDAPPAENDVIHARPLGETRRKGPSFILLDGAPQQSLSVQAAAIENLSPAPLMAQTPVQPVHTPPIRVAPALEPREQTTNETSSSGEEQGGERRSELKGLFS